MTVAAIPRRREVPCVRIGIDIHPLKLLQIVITRLGIRRIS